MRNDDFELQERIIELIRLGKKDQAIRLMFDSYKNDLLRRSRRWMLPFILNDDDRNDAVTDAILECYDHIANSGEGISFLFSYLAERVRNKLRNRNRFWNLFYGRNHEFIEDLDSQEQLLKSLPEHKGTGNSRIFAEFSTFCQLDQECRSRIRYVLDYKYSHRRIAKMMSSTNSETHSRQQYSRCIKKLRKLSRA